MDTSAQRHFAADSAARAETTHGTPLPRQLTVFVGRTAELSLIKTRLTDPNCRLLTLVGAGGMGKTRLALEAAAMLAQHFADGVFLAALQDATTGLAMVTAMARALNLPLAGTHDPQAQLLNFLTDKRVLLVLDNVEQLVDEVGWLATLLTVAPGVKLLATSREVLNLTDEWLLAVGELSVPDEETLAATFTTDALAVDTFGAELEQFDAVRLFAERARRVRPHFSLADEAAAVARICHLVGGLPLALELAAAWLKTLSCAEVAAEIQQSLDILTSSHRDVTPRHRSIRAVCDHSWQRLPAEARVVLMTLAIFPDGFQRHAAQEVSGSTLYILATLVEKSLLRWEPDTRRYQMHQLLRQYALEQLAQDPIALAEAQARHQAYYVAFMRAQGAAMLAGEQRAAVTAIDAELHNIRRAWQWTLDTKLDAGGELETDALLTLARTLIDYYQIRSRYVEGAETLARAITRLRARYPATTSAIPPALALLLTYQGSLFIRLGRIDEAHARLHEAEAAMRAMDAPPMPGYNTDPAFSLGIIALIQGNYAEATRWGEAVRQRSTQYEHAHNLMLADYLLASAALAQGDLGRAQQFAEAACARARATHSHWFMAYCLNELGNIAFAQGNYAAARNHYGESYAIRQAFDDPEGMALALVRLGETALTQDDDVAARELFARGHTLYQQIGDQGGLTATHAGLGRAAVGLHAWEAAREHLHQALTLALAIHYVPYLSPICYGAALLLLATGQRAMGVKVLATIAQHPTTPQFLVERVQQQLSGDLSYLAADFLAASNHGRAPVDLETLGRDLLPMLAHAAPVVPLPASVPPTLAPALIEPLSERELELLRLLAAGLKNREIAAQMVISVNTVKVHINNIYGKLGVSSRVQAVARARELTLL